MTYYTDKLRELIDHQPQDEERSFYILLGRNIAKVREKRALEQKEMAEHIGISQSAMSRIECGNSRISLYDLVLIARMLDKKLTELVPL